MQVLFLEVEPGEALNRITAISHTLGDHLSSGGIFNDGDSFKGHVTLAKLSKLLPRHSQESSGKQGRVAIRTEHKTEHVSMPDSKHDSKKTSGISEQAEKPDEKMLTSSNKTRKRILSFPVNGYKDFLEIDAGSTTVAELHLCRMKFREPGSYYHVETRIPLDDLCTEFED